MLYFIWLLILWSIKRRVSNNSKHWKWKDCSQGVEWGLPGITENGSSNGSRSIAKQSKYCQVEESLMKTTSTWQPIREPLRFMVPKLWVDEIYFILNTSHGSMGVSGSEQNLFNTTFYTTMGGGPTASIYKRCIRWVRSDICWRFWVVHH
jgi:hypothetical protein